MSVGVIALGGEPDGEIIPDAEDDGLKRARDMIEYIEDQVSRGKEMGVEFSEVEGMIQGAKLMLDSGILLDAQELIDQAMEMASQRFTEFGLLQANIRKLENILTG
jgi:hypothetical protein